MKKAKKIILGVLVVVLLAVSSGLLARAAHARR